MNAYLAGVAEAGTISPSRDPEGRARALNEMAWGALLLQLPARRDPLGPLHAAEPDPATPRPTNGETP